MPEKVKQLIEIIRRVPIVNIPNLEGGFSTHPDPVLRGLENSIMVNRRSVLANFDLPHWVEITNQVGRYLQKRENIHQVKKGRKCIDGRYDKPYSEGMVARPGGDYGYALILTALTDPDSPIQEKDRYPELAPEESFDMIFDIVTKDRSKFYMHTDFHDNGTHIGCGHAAAPIKDNEYYRLFQENRASRLLVRARERLEMDKAKNAGLMHMERLEGGHEEQAVLYVTGRKRTIRSQNKKIGEMYFVYDIARDFDYTMKTVLPALAARLALGSEQQNLFFYHFLYLSAIHTDNSLNILANLTPRIMVNLDGFRPVVTMLEPRTKVDLSGKFAGENNTGLATRFR